MITALTKTFFIECDSGITGQALAEKILCFIQTHGLDPTKLCGQAYDGAGNMSGKKNGAAALISSQYPLALIFTVPLIV